MEGRTGGGLGPDLHADARGRLGKPRRRSAATTVGASNAADSARPLGLQVKAAEASRPEDFDQAFAALTRAHVRGLVVVSNPDLSRYRSQIVDLAAKNRVVALYVT